MHWRNDRTPCFNIEMKENMDDHFHCNYLSVEIFTKESYNEHVVLTEVNVESCEGKRQASNKM